MAATIRYHVTFYALTFSLFGFLSFSSQAAPTYLAHNCSTATNVTSVSRFEGNLKALLYSLATNSSQQDGYYLTVMGFGFPDAVNGLFLCRGDLNTTVCQDCVTAAASEVTRRCPNRTEAVIWYNECMLRYTTR